MCLPWGVTGEKESGSHPAGVELNFGNHHQGGGLTLLMSVRSDIIPRVQMLRVLHRTKLRMGKVPAARTTSATPSKPVQEPHELNVALIKPCCPCWTWRISLHPRTPDFGLEETLKLIQCHPWHGQGRSQGAPGPASLAWDIAGMRSAQKSLTKATHQLRCPSNVLASDFLAKQQQNICT